MVSLLARDLALMNLRGGAALQQVIGPERVQRASHRQLAPIEVACAPGQFQRWAFIVSYENNSLKVVSIRDRAGFVAYNIRVFMWHAHNQRGLR